MVDTNEQGHDRALGLENGLTRVARQLNERFFNETGSENVGPDGYKQILEY